MSQLQFAHYADIPVANLAGDFLRRASDVHFARTLRDDGCVLWCDLCGGMNVCDRERRRRRLSPTDRPDLGGTEADDNDHYDDGSQVRSVRALACCSR
jgi:hypothetical protein